MSINKLDLNITDTNMLSIYVHIPFCNSKCSYCSFVSMVASEDDKKKYFADLLNEIRLKSKKYRSSYTVASIYIGGGTPSCLDYYYVRDLLSFIYKNFAVKNSAEITIEINPNSVDRTKIREYILAGVNRFSIGLQSTNPKILKTMGRTHTVEDFSKTVATIREYGVKNISADIIIGYPNQKLIDVKETINYLIKLQIPHISAYMLSIEEGTFLKDMIDKGKLAEQQEDDVVKMYNAVYDTLVKNGYERYEFSNFSKPTFSSYHNQAYWRRKDYIGIGLAAHSYVQGTRFSNTENIVKYNKHIQKEEEPIEVSKNLTAEELKEEAVMLALRTADGLDLDAYKEEFGENFLAKKKDKIASLIKNGFIKLTPSNKLVCTDKGFMVLNRIILELVS